MRETFKQYIFRLMEEQGYATDQDIYKFRKKEGGYAEAERLRRLWQKLQYFKDCKFVEKIHPHRKYLARTADMPKNQYVQIPKELYDEILVS